MVSHWSPMCLSIRLLYVCPSVYTYFHFRTITSKCQWIFTKLGMCIDIVEIWFGIAYGQISSIFDSYLPATRLWWGIFYYQENYGPQQVPILCFHKKIMILIWIRVLSSLWCVSSADPMGESGRGGGGGGGEGTVWPSICLSLNNFSLSHLLQDHWSDIFQTCRWSSCAGCNLVPVHLQIWPPWATLDFSCYHISSITNEEI